MRSRFTTVLLLGVVACGKVLDGPEDAASDGRPAETGGGLVDCKAQRVVHLVGGTGGFAWFTLAWPAPAVILGFQATFAYDSPANTKDVATSVGHPLFARRIGNRAIWEGLGKAPQPSVFVAGTNETHTNQPTSIAQNAGVGLAAAAAAMQGSLAPTIAALSFSPAGPYGQAPGAPPLTSVSNIDGAIGVFPSAVQQQLRPTAAQLARYVPMGAAQVEINFGTHLAFTANAFRLGVVGTVILPALNDDPHGAFTNGPPTARANNLAAMLDAFYSDLATTSETTCGDGGSPLSLADNVVMIVTGDTPKNSFNNAGWVDSSPGNANWIYVRSNGFTKPGWFGQVLSGGRTNFDPATGMLDATVSNAASTGAAFAGTLYAIARGNKTTVQTFTNLPFDGVIQP